MLKVAKASRFGTCLIRITIVIAILAGTVGVELAVPHRADAISVCTFLPDPISRAVCKKTPINKLSFPGIPTPSSIAKSAAKAILKPLLQEAAKEEANAVSSVLNTELGFINSHTTPALSADWFTTEYEAVFGIAVFVALYMFFGRFTVGVKNQDFGELGITFASIVAFLVGAGLIPAIVSGLVKAADGPFTKGWLNLAGQTAESKLKVIENALTNDFNAASITAIFVPLLLLFFGLIGGILSILLLFLRDGALYLFTASEVLTFALWVGGPLGYGAFAKNTKALFGLILLKPIMAFILVVGIQIFTSGQGVDAFILGSLICLMVPFIGYTAYKRISGHEVQAGRHAKRVSSTITSLAAKLAAA
jgi:hypothetical protein